MSEPPATVQVNATAGSYDDVRTLVGMARLEAKLDVAIAQHGARIETHEGQIDDHEVRLRTVEAKPVVTTKGLWSAVLGTVGAVTALVSSGLIPIR